MWDSPAQRGWLQGSLRTAGGFLRLLRSCLPPLLIPNKSLAPLNSTSVLASWEPYLRQLVPGVVQESREINGAWDCLSPHSAGKEPITGGRRSMGRRQHKVAIN